MENKKLPKGEILQIKLSDKKYFEFENGIWTGKIAPFESCKVLRSTNFRNTGKLDYSDVAVLDIEKNKIAKKLLKKNDILIERSGGGPNTPVGRVVLFDNDNDKFVYSNFTTRLRVINENIKPEFIFYFLLNFHWSGNTEKLQTQTTGIRNLEFDNYKDTKIFLPKNLEQQQQILNQIQAKLSEIEKIQVAALRQKDAADSLQSAILREIFKFNEVDKLPKGWKWVTLDEIAKVNAGKSKEIKCDDKELVSFVPMRCVDDISGTIMEIEEKPFEEVKKGYTYFENGDIIFAKITPCMQNGKCAIVEGLKNDFGYGSTEFVVIRPKEEYYRKWIYHFLRSIEFRNKAEEHFTGSAGQQRVPTDFIKNSLISIPNDENEIIRLSDKIENQFHEYYLINKQIAKQLEAIKSLPSAILKEVFEF